MSLQTIINNSNQLTINRRKMVGIQYTRNEIPRVSETPTTNPWRFTVSLPNNLRYGTARSVLEAVDRLDRVLPEIITFSNLPSLSWIFRYQGTATLSQLNTITVSSFVGNQLTLTNLPVLPSTAVLFEPNDLIQIGTNPYPFTVSSQVVRGSSGTVTVTTGRPNILTNPVGGNSIIVGNACQFRMFCPNMPTYKLIVGGTTYQGNVLTGNALIEWSSDFELYEYVGLA